MLHHNRQPLNVRLERNLLRSAEEQKREKMKMFMTTPTFPKLRAGTFVPGMRSESSTWLEPHFPATSSLPETINPGIKASVTFIPSDGTSALSVKGESVTVGETRRKEILGSKDIAFELELDIGETGGKYWACEFSSVKFLVLLSY